jgi:hypothetical protein
MKKEVEISVDDDEYSTVSKQNQDDFFLSVAKRLYTWATK